MSFGALLRARRNEQGMSLEEVALRAGLSVPRLSRIERDRESAPSQAVVEKLAEIISITVDDLLAEAKQRSLDLKDQPAPAFAAYRRLGGGR